MIINNKDRIYISIDFETGGEIGKSCIVEFGIAVFSNYKLVDSYGGLIKPYAPIEKKYLDYSGIDEKELKACTFTLEDMIEILIETCKEYNPKNNKYKRPALVGHNLHAFDEVWIKDAFERCGKNYKDYFGFISFDTLELTDIIFHNSIKLKDRKLGTVCAYLGISTGIKHTAEDDAIACGNLFNKYLKYYSKTFDKATILKL